MGSIRARSSLQIRTLADQLYHLIRERILKGILEEGEPVRQDTIAAELGISKIPLREALARLEQDGLVRSHPNRGFMVNPLSAEEADEVFHLRLQLEPGATAAGCAAAGTADHVAARRAFDALCSCGMQDDADWGECNRAFHMALIRPASGNLTYTMIERLNVIADRYVRFHLGPQGRPERANIQHEDILRAWLAGDSDTVLNMVRDHIRETHDDLRKELPAITAD
ncbi:GntR family transcriptional regulator [Komagataeibacter sp. FNDCF1]|uniref:GntR family transcriptional regulator n=1 Tax=Komagataeibacter sp. FNDCF1 TaxID=2878681 RepID=UPI001E63206D|nr:GntR family transcriptional regulator [Komagataeibacter sp. FNDCF1]MCE2563285.1 GntR family transcriptional regulator [Komagataeibacter sp. FNDCF1]